MVVPVNRWAPDDYSIQIDSGTWTVTATLDQINRGETPTYQNIGVVDSTGTTVSGVGLTAGIYKLDFFPAEAFQLQNTNLGAGVARLMQGGATDW